MASGHSLHAIGEYTLDQFLAFSAEVGRQRARSRIEFVVDMSAVVGGLFDGKAIKKHVELLTEDAE